MNRKLILFIAIILALSISIANAQTVWDKQTYNQPDSADLLPNSGRIILNGRLLEPPYDIIVENDTIKINDIPLISQGTPIEFSRDSNSIKNATLKYNLITASIDSFNNACKNVGYDSALALMSAFFNGKEGVDSAYIDEHYGFLVKFRNSIGPMPILYEPPDSGTEIDCEKHHRDSVLIKEVIRFKKAVGSGNLVILGDNGAQIYLKYAQKWIKEIDRIIDSGQLSPEEKLKALSGIAMDKEHAESILQNWGKR